MLEADLRRCGQRVHGLAGRDAQLRPPEIADELQDPLVHLSSGGERPPAPPPPDPPTRPRRPLPSRSLSSRGWLSSGGAPPAAPPPDPPTRPRRPIPSRSPSSRGWLSSRGAPPAAPPPDPRPCP